ncbi:serine hydrolase domain-containing protein [Actinopolymorpha rutila]|uniref:CubicO group peptidase (Beta-lactamase class C family) n=1 Tax=Actinopolymorpha rutila TaxID=446787 RepID=A0A852ZMY1_9ACTN|nr:serine hydrolase domain-containing protein [Actinopolymorpha rutila]NYH93475.1 CubicO group peptidase (beta-lactamase class C family) [Actinopolymorpha rutila]
MPGRRFVEWQQRLDELVRRHGVPGASLAVLADGDVSTAASGVLNVGTGVTATPDSVFQIGSITKIFTTTLVMRLVDEHQLDLDQKVAELLPEFRLADADALGRITVRHLLTHTSGIPGDHFVDTGRGDDAVEKYVETCADLGLVHPIGSLMSYCNTGFVLAGRIVERLTGLPWREALRTRLLRPAGLRETTALPEEALRFRVAYGHDVDGDQPPTLVARWQLPSSTAPAGSTLCATARDVVGMARVHLDGGLGVNGREVLTDASVAAMRTRSVALHRGATAVGWGLGWALYDWNGRRAFGHDGGTIGQSSFLRVVPDAGVAIALLTNGGRAEDLYQELFEGLLAEFCDLALPPRRTPPDVPVGLDLTKYAGTYATVGRHVELAVEDRGLVAKVSATDALAEVVAQPVEEYVLVPVEEDLFLTRAADARSWTPVAFSTLEDGSRYAHLGLRALPKVS